MPLDPHVKRLIDTLSLAEARTGAAEAASMQDVRRHRDAFRGLMRLSEPGPPAVDVADGPLPGPAGPLALRVYTPASASPDTTLPGMLYLHGGGFVCGDLDTHDPLCRTLCEGTGCRVIALDYRRAPEHPFPAAIEDALAAAAWMIARTDVLRLDPARLVIAGDSAGATLAAVVCQQLARTHPGAVALQLLLCPILDWSLPQPGHAAAETGSRGRFGRGFLLDRDAMARELDYYLPTRHDPRDPLVSPLHAAELHGQPATHIHTAEYDPLCDDGRDYAERLARAAVPVRHTCHAGMIHLFYGFGRLVPYARTALARIGSDVRDALV